MNKINYLCRNSQRRILPTRKKIATASQSFINEPNNRLDVNSESSKFFGVDSRLNIFRQLENNIELINLKYKKGGILKTLLKRVYFSVDKPSTFNDVRKYLWEEKSGRRFEQLLDKPARLTFDGKFFGSDGTQDTHTIGLLYDKKSKTLFCLDSLPNFIKEVKKYQDILKNYIFKSPEIKNIIFSNKPQQKFNEYTCNNWTIANIEALQQALKKGKTIKNTQQLNSVLPDNINEILNEQYKYVKEQSV